MNKIGIMQGRLTNPNGKKEIQFFPYKNWYSEFEKAKLIGLDYIEWIMPYGTPNPFNEGFVENEVIKCFIKKYIPINVVCLDFFMNNKFLKLSNESMQNYLNFIFHFAYRIDCKLIVIPVYEKDMNIELFNSIFPKLYPIRIAFEFLNVNWFSGINFINDLNDSKKYGCCFDIGDNYQRDIIKGLEMYNKYNKLTHIHIKEKNKKGKTVSLGGGTIGKDGWENIFKFLKDIDYSGDFTLQVVRGKNGKEIATVQKQFNFIRNLLL